MPREPEQEWPASFKELFCRIYNCRPENFERKLLWRAMFRHALIPAFFVSLFSHRFFHIDITEIRLLGTIRSPEHFNRELDLFHGRNVRDKNWLRRLLRIRISGRRLLMERNKVTEWVLNSSKPVAVMTILLLQPIWLLG